jgi:hypothetical protein
MLPDHVTYVSSSAKPMGSGGVLSGDAVEWTNGGVIRAGKSKTYAAELRVRVH